MKPVAGAAPWVKFVGEPIPKVSRVRKEYFAADSQWLRFGRVFFKSEHEEEVHGWEMVERTTRKGDVDGVDVYGLAACFGAVKLRWHDVA